MRLVFRVESANISIHTPVKGVTIIVMRFHLR